MPLSDFYINRGLLDNITVFTSTSYKVKMSSQPKKTNKNNKKVTDSDRIVFCDDGDNTDDVKAKMAEAAKEITSNTLDEQTPIPNIEFRNAIKVPPNCPPGQKPDENGVCRDAF